MTSARPHRGRWLHSAVDYSLVLPLGALVALVWANAAPASYFPLAHRLEFAVNDVGMVFFFALAAKEVVEATSPGGALHTWRRASVPVVAAAGGMIGPALIYVACVHALNAPELSRGWAIPCATDIAFSYLVARGVFRQHPAVPFLLLLAIADDAFGLVILAAFYPVRQVRPLAFLAMMGAAVALAYACRRREVRSLWPYILCAGSVSWTSLYIGGLHPALALVPIVPFLPHAARDPGLFVPAPPGARDTLSRFERVWKYPVQGVLLLFGLVNAGVPLSGTGPGTWAVLAAILAGKPIGISLSVFAAVGFGLKLPSRISSRELVVLGFAAAIGFTVALFFATAAFPPGRLLDEAKLGALASVCGALATFASAAVLKVGRFESVRKTTSGRSSQVQAGRPE